MRVTRKTYFAVNFILFFFALAVSFSVIAVILFSSQRYSAHVKTALITEQVGKDLSDTLTRIDRTSKSLFLNEDFQNLTDDIYGATDAVEDINSHFGLIISLDQYLYKNVIYLPRSPAGELDESKVLSYGVGYEYIQNNIREIIELSDLPENLSGKAFYKKIFYYDGGDAPFFAVARNVYDVRSESYLERMGIGIIFINSNKTEDALEYSVALDGLEVCVLGAGEVITSSAGFTEKSLGEKGFYRINYDLNNFGWRVVGIYNENFTLKSVGKSYIYLLTVTVVAGIAFVIVSTLVYRKSTESLDYLFKVFSDFKENSFVKPLNYKDDADVNKVIDSFNGMLDSVASLNDAVLEEKNRSLMLELENTEYMLASLYSQINKHFLINVLSLMRSLVNLGETEKVKSCIENLSEFLRYSLNLNDSATVGQEIEMLGAYLNIQTLRYPNVKCEIACEDAVKDATVPKMILQPIIENAFVHGLPKKKGVIKVICRKRRGFIYFFVADNGCGIESEKAKEINACLKNNIKINSLEGSGVALGNIQKRLKLVSGDSGIIRILSAKGRGTVVMVKFYGGENV